MWQGKELGKADVKDWKLEVRWTEERGEKPGTSWPGRQPVQRGAIVEFTRNGSTIFLICQVKIKYF